MQAYPRASGPVCLGHLHGAGCLSTRTKGTGCPTALFTPPCRPLLLHLTHIPSWGLPQLRGLWALGFLLPLWSLPRCVCLVDLSPVPVPRASVPPPLFFLPLGGMLACRAHAGHLL